MIKTTVSNTQQIKADIKKAIQEFASDAFVTVGIHEEAGEHEGGISNAQLGAVLHFGNDRIPARRFLDIGVEAGNQEYFDIISNVAKNGGTLEEALEAVGVVAVGKVQEFMIALRTPPNAESTIEMKGSSNPLIDTSNLLQSMTSKVVSTRPEEGL